MSISLVSSIAFYKEFPVKQVCYVSVLLGPIEINDFFWFVTCYFHFLFCRIALPKSSQFLLIRKIDSTLGLSYRTSFRRITSAEINSYIAVLVLIRMAKWHVKYGMIKEICFWPVRPISYSSLFSLVIHSCAVCCVGNFICFLVIFHPLYLIV